MTRVTALIARLCGVSYTLRGTCYLLHRLGLSPQVRSTGPDFGHVWTAKTTTLGATAVQAHHSSHRESRGIEHIGSAQPGRVLRLGREAHPIAPAGAGGGHGSRTTGGPVRRIA